MDRFSNGQEQLEDEEDSLALEIAEEDANMEIHPPIVSSYNDHIRPLLDAVDKLRLLNVAKEGIQLPTIVVVGDQSSGKSSVLESLAGINLPRGLGICTRVPLVMTEHHPTPIPELFLEFNGKTVHTDEAYVADAINLATNEIAGDGKGISNTPLTLVVKKSGVPDLTMIDLPGITRVPVHGQPENIYEQIAGIIMEYIRPEESIILNVLSATVDFSTCESIRMSQQVDKNGKRTLAVVTKSDKAPEGLLEKVTADDVNIGLGYVCVRNRIGDESYEEARKEEAKLFNTHPLLSRINKSMVGIPVLAQKLTQIQASIIARCLPGIVRKIDEKLNASILELNRIPKTLSSSAEAMTAFMGIFGSAKETLRKILIRGDELHNCRESDPRRNFLMEEIHVLQESRGIELPNFLPRSAFLTILKAKVEGISSVPVNFIEKVWNYIENVLVSVLTRHSENYHQLHLSTRRAGHNLISKMKEQSISWVTEIVQMEKVTDYTCNPEYMSEWKKLMDKENTFRNILENRMSKGVIEGIGEVEVGNLSAYNQNVLHEAFDLKMRVTAYWNIVLRRLVDSVALHFQFSVQNLVNKKMENEIFSELISSHGGAIERMLEESPSVAVKREKLNKSIKLLGESMKVLGNIMDRIATYDN
ncbi:hypothetical protein GH714_006884 [Hevea brasiliensis]|uniref:Dynamin-type G domain-containing protein n=1 Tax=Hevea brasiliensis TaxID=3981 RepID=A0A6A6KHE4_HEVBR|nr:hypothetical protein GH714_006884 [Hevea brasiliensis]